MSNMKYDAIVEAGIRILERVPIPDELIPADSKSVYPKLCTETDQG